MSYAAVTKENREPLSQQPHPDTGLLNTEPPAEGEVQLPDGDSTKVTVAPSDWKEHPKSVAEDLREQKAAAQSAMSDNLNAATSGNTNGSAKRKERKERTQERLDEYEEEGKDLWARAKHTILQPGVAGGLLGVVNLGLLGTVSYKLYTEPHLRTDQRFITTSALSALAIFGAEGYFADAYSKTDAGQREAAKAREEGGALYSQAKQIILRPGVLGGVVGVLNVGVLGGLGYWSYVNWDHTYKWDRKTVSTATVGLIALFAGEGYLGEQYKEKEYPKHK